MSDIATLLHGIDPATEDRAELAERLAAWRHHVRTTGATDVPELCGVAAVHPLPWVRHATSVELYRRHFRDPRMLDLARWLSHDYEDYIAFHALDFLGARGSRAQLRDIYAIIGLASERLFTTAGKPVGIGHAVALRAIRRIVNSQDRTVYEEIERSLFDGFDDTEFVNPPCDLALESPHDHAGMAAVSAGQVHLGMPPALAESGHVFDWPEERRTVDVAAIHIDVHPVTAAEYRAFSGSEAARDHTWCHPHEPKGKIHWANTLLDPRSSGSHPVTGVDWFDAFAYARWRGKRLPTEEEWQRASMGASEQVYPWGDDFRPDQVHGLYTTACRDWASVVEWREQLLELFDDPPAATTCSVTTQTNTSEFGVHGMAGNVWEWTSSAYLGGAFNPQTTQGDALDVVYDQTSYAVIKGGAWTSSPEQMSPAFRGRDLAFDRHFEIGFRCACSCGEAS